MHRHVARSLFRQPDGERVPDDWATAKTRRQRPHYAVLPTTPWREERPVIMKTQPRSRSEWKPTFAALGRDTSVELYNAELFARILQYERLRADRLNSPISLVSVRIISASGSEEFSEALKVLSARVRSTDMIGRLDDVRIAVLLPSTDLRGAVEFAESVMAVLPAVCGPVEVSTHPDAPEPTELNRLNGSDPSGSRLPAEQEAHGCVERVIRGESFENTFVRPTPNWKRTLDLVGSGGGLLFSAPIFAVIAVYIKLVSPGPVFYTQARVGQGAREFRFIKFRTMHVNNDESYHTQHAAQFIRSNGTMEKLDEHDPRIYFGGRLLRLLCIDELPQLYNVLRGEMSLVGPRPCIPYEAAEYQRWHRHRFSILPGLTGLWQVSGKNKLSFAEMIRLDIQYEKTMSLGVDLTIILRTIPTIVGLLLEAVGRRLSVRKRPPLDSGENGTHGTPPESSEAGKQAEW